jgi:hypothetical protein
MIDDNDDVLTELRKAIQEKDFSSLEEVQAFADALMPRQNQTPLDDFHGLSPAQMHSFFYFPFDSPGLVDFVSPLETEPEAPVITLFRLLVEAIGEKGLKTTTSGNLPRDFCREAALRFWGEEGYRERTRYGGINKEFDFFDMHITRLIAKLAGLLRKYRGRFLLTKECLKLLDKQGMSGVYPRLLHSYAAKFNWAYRGGLQQLPFVQQSFLFTLYLLTKYGDDWRPHVFYEDCFLRAFPKILTQVEPRSYSAPERSVRSCYIWRTLVGFVAFFGLADVESVGKDRYDYEYRVRSRPLLSQAVRFSIT